MFLCHYFWRGVVFHDFTEHAEVAHILIHHYHPRNVSMQCTSSTDCDTVEPWLMFFPRGGDSDGKPTGGPALPEKYYP